VNTEDFPVFSDASGTGLVRQGSIWLSEPEQEGIMPGEIPGNWKTAFSFTLSEDAGFRLGVAVDAMDSGDRAPDHVSVWNVATGEVFSTLLTRDGSSDMVFFDIQGSEGDEFEVRLWQEGFNRYGFALITFDELPAPPPPTLVCTRAGNLITLSWQPEITGWVLESSTDLGVSDAWSLVPGVSNNSVSVSMDGVPKNFFRLRKDP
jgi:hypothetical protein